MRMIAALLLMSCTPEATSADDTSALVDRIAALEAEVVALRDAGTVASADHEALQGVLTSLGTLEGRVDDLAVQVAEPEGPEPGEIIQAVVAVSNVTTSIDSVDFVEADPSYRVTFTPKYDNSVVLVEYSFGMNTNMDANTIFHMRLVRDPDGPSPQLVGVGPPSGDRDRVSFVGRPGNGRDQNDQLQVTFRGADRGLVAGVPVTYGFQYRRETGGLGVAWFNTNSDPSPVYGFSGVMTITAIEIAP